MLKVKSFMANNQAILNDGDKVIFQSYESIIAVVENGQVSLSDHWDYSKTTKKYLCKFLNNTVGEIKILIANGTYQLNIDVMGERI